jgi:DNA-binding beta-propeller fold protein YncE
MASSQVQVNLVRRIPLPDVTGRIDHLSADLRANRLFVAALGNNSVEVVDLAKGVDVHSLRGLNEPQGVQYVADPATLWVANGGDGSCALFDPRSFSLLRSIDLGSDADNIRYDGARNEVLVGYGDGAIGIFDAAAVRQVATIHLHAHPESFQISGERLFVNLPGAREIAVVDLKSRSVLTTITPSARSNFPMALDEHSHRLFVGCRNPSRLLVFDTDSLKERASVEISGDVDDIALDGRGFMYCACGEGFLDVIQSSADGGYSRVGHVRTAPGARTALMLRDRIYVAAPRSNNHPAGILVYTVSSE